MAVRKPRNLKALNELKISLINKCKEVHCITERYNSEVETPDTTKARDRKRGIIAAISKQIEDWSISQFGKDFGVHQIKICKREDATDPTKLDVQLGIRKFPGAEADIKAGEASVIAYHTDLHRIDTWHMKCLAALASGDEMPEPPEDFNKKK